MTLTKGTLTKLGLLSSLYLSQGLPFGFFTQALPVLLQRMGLSLPAIGLSHLLALPWMLKFLWSPLMDRRGPGRLGRRRGVILPIQILSALLLLALAVPAGGPTIPWLCAAVLCINLLAATQDVATDGLAVDLLSADELGWGNGVQVAAYRVGMILGGSFLLLVFDASGFRITLTSLGVMLLVATLPIAVFREPPAASPPPRESPSLSYWFKRPGAFSWLGLLFVYKAGEHFASGMLKPFFVDPRGAGLGMREVGWMIGGVGFAAGLVGAMLGGGLVRRLGYRRALLGFGALQALGVLLYALVAWRPVSISTLAVVCGLEHLTSGMATASLFTAMMEACRPEHAAADYTVQASVVVAATGVAAAASGFSAGALGYAAHFALAAGLAALALVFVGAVFRTLEPARARA
ncbi:MFS transporter [Polyangium mundeleinium]|uniref:MFS transporter n=1 Tax=Polyangium mundeleinium TaxID=2995306 RepID=A0ABT5EZP5_9BACT|nr:MFS transporter [Polyangium mundeleinium]MDC0747305.1 MFS transporter [Polyangium mundeleinium]